MQQSPSGASIADSEPGGSRDERMQRLEAVLFLAREPLNSRKLSQYANLADGTEARTLIRRLNALYTESGRAFRVEEMGGGFRLMTRPPFASWLKRLAHVPAEVRLSGPALETLAVVAYRQPILKAAVEAIRGVNCGEVLRQLMERDLVRIVGRSEDLGRPYLYGPTRNFLEVFGLRSLDELPQAERFRAAAREEELKGTRGDAPPLHGNDSQNLPLNDQPQKETVAVTVRTPAHPDFEAPHTAEDAALLPTLGGAVAALDEDDEEELDDDEEDDFDDLDEDLDEDEEWEDDDEDELDEEWEEVEDEEELDDEDDDWEDDDEDWEDD
jgi:segregation and condensation protein B